MEDMDKSLLYVKDKDLIKQGTLKVCNKPLPDIVSIVEVKCPNCDGDIIVPNDLYDNHPYCIKCRNKYFIEIRVDSLRVIFRKVKED